eukprot:gene20139-biopygen7042
MPASIPHNKYSKSVHAVSVHDARSFRRPRVGVPVGPPPHTEPYAARAVQCEYRCMFA